MDPEEENNEDIGFWDRVKYTFSNEDENENVYRRKLMDRKIERYLDANFDSYVEEYGMVREIDLIAFDEKHGLLVDRVRMLKEFVQDADGEIGGLEKRLEKIRKGGKAPKG